MYKLVTKKADDNNASPVSSTQLVVSETQSSAPALSSDIKIVIDAKIDETEQKIAEGLSKETASTGTPMENLSGAAEFTATLSNIGGGSKETGGGGMKKGLQVLNQNIALKGVKKGTELADIIKVALPQ